MELMNLLKKLYPICRSITGNGQLETLNIIRKEIPINILEYPTGEKCYDWMVPKEWNIHDGCISNISGEKIIDFKSNNLHIAGYSIPFKDRISLDELKKHLHYRSDLPDAIPYVTYYHKNDWAFCLTKNQYNSLNDNMYDVQINSTLTDGYLRIGEYYKQGLSNREIWLSTYTCHPSMCNDNLSGILAGVELIKYLETLKGPKYSYRVLFLPETIGPLVYLWNNKNIIKNIYGGYVLTHCADNNHLTYKRSIHENHPVDDMMMKALVDSGKQYQTQPYVPFGSDERQYSSPRFKLAFGSLMRSSHTPMDLSNPFEPEWKEYHTSFDNLDFISENALQEVIDIYKKCIEYHEYNIKYRAKYYGEPWLSKHGLYVSPIEDLEKSKGIFYFQGFADGKNSLWDIHNISNVKIDILNKVADEFYSAGLVERVI